MVRAVYVVVSLLCGCGRLFGPCNNASSDATSPDAANGIRRVQTVSPGSMRGVATISFPITVTGGDLLVVVPYSDTNPGQTLTAVSSSLNDAWQTLPTESSTCNIVGSTIRLWYAPIAGSGADTITLDMSLSGNLGVLAIEYAGVDLARPVETSSGLVASATTGTMTAGPLSATTGDLVVAAFSDHQTLGTAVPGQGFTVQAHDDAFAALVEDAPAGPATTNPSADLPSGKSDACWVATAMALRPR
jgi:hypothetical protein